jgi:hypothetical protein
MASFKEITGRLILYDSLAVPGHPVSLIAELVEEGIFTHAPLGGEVLAFFQGDRSLGHAMTGGDGRAVKSFVPPALGVVAVAVRLENVRRVTAAATTARVFVWDRRHPLVWVSFSALVPRARKPGPGFSFPGLGDKPPDPEGEAVKALATVSRRAHLVYVTAADRMEVPELRQWADQHRLPAGPIFSVNSGPRGLAHEIETRRREGWNNIKGGLAGTAEEAKVMVAKGVKTVISPSAPAREKWPEKAVKTKDWTEAARRLLS